MAVKINNRMARRFWIAVNGLGKAPTARRGAADIVCELGFVQLDTIRNVVRAHDHIVWSRAQNYQEGDVLDLLKTRDVFEHFTHDASVLPMDTLPMWERQFKRRGERVAKYYKNPMPKKAVQGLLDRIEAEGPLSTHAFDTKAKTNKMWARPPHKMALDTLWNAGQLATSHRDGFIKFYDLAARVFPSELRRVRHSDDAQIDWLCHAALRRLGFASIGEIARFWGAVSIAEARAWAKNADLVKVLVQGKNGDWVQALALPDFADICADLPPSTTRLRILNPFDPVARDRDRLQMLFGFHYKIEIFVPAAKRKWGYYVYPVLQGDRFIGRIDLKADRKSGVLHVVNLWAEAGVSLNKNRLEKLEKELDRLRRFAGLSVVHWQQSPT